MIKYFKKKNYLFKILLWTILICINLKIKNEKLIYIEVESEINNIQKYYELNNKGILKNLKKFTKSLYPKISIVSALYNNEKYILRFIRSIQNQFFDDIEIIFVDDCSKDNSKNIITKIQKEDERIILIKQKSKKGTLFSRNIGVLFSKGEYLMLPDSDDILSEDIMNQCYNIAIKNDYEMIRFNMYSEKFFPFSLIPENLKNPIFQPELSNYLFYGYGYKKIVDGIISNKFIKTQTYLKSLNSINNYYLNQYMTYFEDGLINFALHRNAKSLYLLKKIGYYYIFNKNSVSRHMNINSYIKCFFIFIKYIYESIKKNKYEKNIVSILISIYIQNMNVIKGLSNNLGYKDFCEKIINEIINDKYISTKSRNKLKKIRHLLKINIKN